MKQRTVKRLERYRSKKSLPSIVGKQGLGKAKAREARELNVRLELQKTKKHSSLMQDLVKLDPTALSEQLEEARKELFDLRFQNATGQLINVAAIPRTRRRIARILTLIGQKRLGA